MPTPYETFIASMEMNYEKWHDGIGYDLEALKNITKKSDLKAVETLLVGRADRDWRDLDALAALGSQRAWIAILKVARAGGPQALHAAKLLSQHQPDTSPALVETQLLQRIRAMPADGSVTEVLQAAKENPTDAVKAALLSAARFSVNPTFRCHAAAMLLFLAGITKEEFDWSRRPLFLKCGSPIPRESGEGYRELCALLKI